MTGQENERPNEPNVASAGIPPKLGFTEVGRRSLDLPRPRARASAWSGA
jgi:hypothetical protein